MSLFIVIARGVPEKLRNKVREVYPNEYVEFSNASWFVYDTLTAEEVATKLQLKDGSLGAEGIVIPAAAWVGYGPSAVWDWLRVRRLRDNPSA